ncbi:PSD1 and planctomycete cytochrome C domain-containing protein [Roseiconus lacunae]|uniref:PSD1 and planctomycete cytochrome C domain-containing protein n=1 Tax=Roseiconus lacunae TaxID=2605694 RepID=UPI001F3CEEBF|nr:PSD1 and planctomycete cytochrome C domain-containing protein [Roseiconus lacunae]
MHFKRSWLATTVVLGFAMGQVVDQSLGRETVDPKTVSAPVDFDEHVLPILEDRCLYCHGEDEQESGLRLDRRAFMIKGGDSGLAAVVPGKPSNSYLIDVIKHLDPDVKMPPDDDKLPAEEIEVLQRWVEQGATWPDQMDDVIEDSVDLWSFQPVKRPTVPAVDATNSVDVQSAVHPIDAFLREKLFNHNLTMSDRADPRILLRRLSIILTGLPPTAEEIEAYLVAEAKDPERAYADAVDRLLKSPHFGERWAQHWLDVIRWAETNGSEANLYRKNAWVYRDYVIRSFNEDKPYDQFLREQIAGDSVGVGEAMGFLVAGPHVPAATVGREPSAIRQARADRLDEVIQTVGASVMGVTMGCARCHNHKFDPISIHDYYSMTAVFEDIEFGSRHPEYSPEHPVRQRGAEIWKSIAERRKELRATGGWEEDWGAYRELHFNPVTTTAIRLRFKMKNLFVDEIEVLGNEGLHDNLALASRGTKVSGFPEKGFQSRNPINRVNDGEYGTMIWRAKVEKGDEQPWVQFDFSKPETINRLRLSNNREYFYETDYLTRKPHLPRYEYDVDIRTEDGQWQPWVGTWVVNKKLNQEHPERRKLTKEIQGLIEQLAEEGPRPSFVGRLIEPAPTHVLLRGSPESPRDEVAASGPKALAGDLQLTFDDPGPKRRRAFADWIASPDNPLTARVMVNRIWHHIFGSGLVTTTSDFGNAGARPTHPELLDWLAAEFVAPTKSGSEPKSWSVKHVVRLLVTSDAFRQSSHPREEAIAIDGGAQWLWRFPPKRVEAEVIRDTILQASGTLDRTLGGRSYRIHNVKETYAQWEVVDNYGAETWRRMIYQERMRRVDDQMFTAFDFPDCGQVRAKRPVSTTPLQALNLMNSDFVIDQSKRIADRATSEVGDAPAEIVNRCFQLLLGRNASAAEQQNCKELLKSGDVPLLCRAIINSNEFAFLQ